MLAMVLLAAAAPGMAQDDKAAKQAQKAEKQAQKAAKAEAKAAQPKPSEKMKEMPKTGGIPISASLLGLGAGALLVGGGLLVRKATR